MDLHALRTSIFVREWSHPPSDNFAQHTNGLARTACMLAYVQRRSVGESTLARALTDIRTVNVTMGMEGNRNVYTGK